MAKRSADNAYFLQLEQADDVFTPTWSLGVEMQFYLLAPPIFYALRRSHSNFVLSILCYGALFVFSFGYHLLSNSFTSFNSVLCRIWQFEVGMIAFHISESLKPDERTSYGNDREKWSGDTGYDSTNLKNRLRSPAFAHAYLMFSLVTLTVCALWPIVRLPLSIRFVSTVISGFVIVFGTVVERNPLSNRALVYLGDISYALYLVHWPIYVWVKFYYPDGTIAYYLAIIVAGNISVFISETFEKWYLKLDKREIITLLTTLYILIILVIVQKDKLEQFAEKLSELDDIAPLDGRNLTRKYVVQMNWKFDRDEKKMLRVHNCFPNETEHGFCEVTKQSLNGKLDIALLGNSYTPNFGSLVHDAFAKYARRMTKFSRTSCEVLVLSPECAEQQGEYMDYVERMRPDVLFILSKHNNASAPFNGGVTSDPVFQKARKNLQKYEHLVKRKVFILNAIPTVTPRHMRRLNKMITEGGELDIGEQTFKYAQARMAELQKRCAKCEMFDLDEYLLDSDGNPRVFDPNSKLSYYTSGVHLTPIGLKLVRPAFEKLGEKFGEEYEKWFKPSENSSIVGVYETQKSTTTIQSSTLFSNVSELAL